MLRARFAPITASPVTPILLSPLMLAPLGSCGDHCTSAGDEIAWAGSGRQDAAARRCATTSGSAGAGQGRRHAAQGPRGGRLAHAEDGDGAAAGQAAPPAAGV